MKVFVPVLLFVILLISLSGPVSKAFTEQGTDAGINVSAAASEALLETGGPPMDFPSVSIVPHVVGETQEEVQAVPSTELLTESDILGYCPAADGFAYPVGAPDGKGYRDVQPFGKNNHLGEDWNGGHGKGGNGDLGDPIYSIADGVVTYAQPVGKKCRYGWGNVVKIVHNAGTQENPRYVESLYAHLDEIKVKNHQLLKRGDPIGTMGNCNGVYWSHLHFELRSEPFLPIGRGYGVNKKGYLDPKKFIEQHRFDQDDPNSPALFAGRPTPKP